jgi:hypothetical protein
MLLIKYQKDVYLKEKKMKQMFSKRVISIVVMIAFVSVFCLPVHPAHVKIDRTGKQEKVNKPGEKTMEQETKGKVESETEAEIDKYYAKNDANVIENEGYSGKKKKKFPWLLVAAGAVVIGVILIIAIKPQCNKVDLVIDREYPELDYPGVGDSVGNNCFVIKNIKHPSVTFPVNQCFHFIAKLTEDGSTYFSKYVCGADIVTLNNTGEVVIKFHSPDCIALPGIEAIVDDTNVVDECDENNNVLMAGVGN